MPNALRKAENRVGNGRRTALIAALARVVRTAATMLDTIEHHNLVLDRRLAGHLMALRDSCEKARNELARNEDT